jgi:hypothetical protein
MKKSNKGQLIYLVFTVIIFAVISILLYINNKNNTTVNTLINNKYLTTLEWTLPTVLKVSVEIDTYDGDILRAGTYKFEETNTLGNREKDERIYNIYVSKNNYSSESELLFDDLKISIGGLQNENIGQLTVEKGDYIYISPVPENRDSIGHLKVTRK